jgi:hypothetical protein
VLWENDERDVPFIYIIHNFLRLRSTMHLLEILLHPRDEMIFESILDELV